MPGTLGALFGLLVLSPPALGASVSAGGAHSAVVKTTDSTAWTWGLGTNGRLGDGTQNQRSQPVQVTSLTGVTMVAAGGSHTLFLKSDGTVWASGLNSSGQLGFDSTATQSLTPVAVVGITGTVVGISAGDNHSLAWTSDGKLYAFGANTNGQLGLGDTTLRRSAVQVLVGGSPSKFVANASAGASHSLAVTSETTIYAFGYNLYGRLGTGNQTQQTSPVPVVDAGGTPVTGFTAVSAGGSHSLALKSDGTVWGYGANNRGQLGLGDTTLRLNPVQMIGPTTAIAISAGASHSLEVESDGTVFATGENSEGQLGDGGVVGNATLPQAVPGIANAVSVVAAANHSLAVTSDNVVYAFGRNTSSQLGDGTTQNRLSPVAISDPGFVWKAATPTMSPGSGPYWNTVSVTLASATSGATIRYTLDGSDPTTGSTAYSSAFNVTQTTTVKARAWKAGLPTSNAGSATYELRVINPTITPGTATYSTPQNVSLATTTSGATVYYTLDGSEPSTSSTAYTAPVVVDTGLTLKARAFKTNWTPSATTTGTYTMKVGTPSLTPAAGTYGSVQQVTPTTVTPGATLRYTTTGLEPTGASAAATGTILVDRSQSLKVRGFRSGWVASDTTTANYFLTLGTAAVPTFNPPAGGYASPQSVTLSSATVGAVVRFTTDGSEPTSQSPIFGEAFTISGTTTVKAKAFRADMVPSATVTAVYTITLGAVATPTMSVASGIYTTARTLTVSVATSGATIHYTTTGADPTEADPTITSGGTLVVDRATIVKARAWLSGVPTSAVARRDYVVTGAVAAGGNHTLVLKTDGTVVAAGMNGSGQLGDTTTTNRPSPVAVSGLSGVVAIAAGGSHSLALKSDGTVVSYGLNTSGQLGDSTWVSKSAAVAVSGLTGVVAIAAGADHSLALKSDGTVVAWGNGGSGRLGDGATTNRNAPVAVSGLTGITAIAAGADHSLALTSAGSVMAWGNGSFGQLGDANTQNRLTPVAAVGPSGFTRLVAGAQFSMAVQASGLGAGTLWSCGRNSSAQLGDGTLLGRTTLLNSLVDVATLGAGQSHALVALSNGRLLGWGTDGSSQVGDGAGGTNQLYPSYVLTSLEALDLSGGAVHSLALGADGRVYTWGSSSSGQLADGSGTSVVRGWPAVAGTLQVTDNTWLASDTDSDGLSNAAEYRLGTDPLNPDSNGNGIPDGIEAALGWRPFDPDADGDGVPNAIEQERGTNPFDADSDDDGVVDGLDAFPLDPTRSQAVVDPNDHTAPTVTLLEPAGAQELP